METSTMGYTGIVGYILGFWYRYAVSNMKLPTPHPESQALNLKQHLALNLKPFTPHF